MSAHAHNSRPADTVDQAIDRAGTKAGNKGFDAAQGALEMVKLPGRMA